MHAPVLELVNVSRRFRAGIPGCSAEVVALSHVSLTVGPGECVAIVGGAGAGKTTLLLCAAGILRPDSGEVRVVRAEYVPPGSALIVSMGQGAARAVMASAVMARAVRERAGLLCIDDPFALQAGRVHGRWRARLDELRREGVAVLVSSRREEALGSLASRIVQLEWGRVAPRGDRTASRVAEGRPRDHQTGQ